MSKLEEVNTDNWHTLTFEQELVDLLPSVSRGTREAFYRAEEDSISVVVSEEDRRLQLIVGATLEVCPAARKRIQLQNKYQLEDIGIIKLPEWRGLVSAMRSQTPILLADTNKIFSTSFSDALQRYSTIHGAQDTIIRLLGFGRSLYPELLLLSISDEFPEAITRYLLEKHDVDAVFRWVEEVEDPFTRFQLDEENALFCAEAEELETFDFDAALDASKISPDKKSLNLLRIAYPGPSTTPILEAGLRSLVMQSLFTDCAYFKKITFEQGLQEAMEELDPTAEEKKQFRDLANNLCKCIGLGGEESEECFKNTMGELGLSVESIGFGTENSPKQQRLMLAYMALMPRLAMSCQR